MNPKMGLRKTNLFGIVAIFISLHVEISNAFDVETDLVFRLYTRDSPDVHSLKADPESISKTPFNSNRPTRIFVHGYKSKEKVIHRYRDAYLDLDNYNFIAVDWINGASTFNYYSARSRVKTVALNLSEMIDALVAYGMKLDDLTIVGHSLGAHISGQAARYLKSAGKVPVIIGLDPASFGFNHFAVVDRLNYTDAKYVQVIHTDGDKFGLIDPLGHADFYPNGGKHQPGCYKKDNPLSNFIDKCNHVRSHHLFLESLKTPFKAIQCASVEEINELKCTFKNVTGIMGGDLNPESSKPLGIFYLLTKSKSPYNVPDFHSFYNTDSD